MTARPMFATVRAVVLVTAALAVPGWASAHDPGLSALDVVIHDHRIVATLSIASADAQRLGSPLDALGPTFLECVAVDFDGVPVQGRIESPPIADAAGVSATLVFDRPSGGTLRVRSLIAERITRGHRQLLTVRHSDGQIAAQHMLDARANSVAIGVPGRAFAAGAFVELGLRHILGGYDHLLFLAALLLTVRTLGGIVRTVTAFTVAHSLTLALAVFGLVEVPPSIVEPVIAASIVYVGVENVLRPHVDARWKLTFAFGLVHGFGFAGALRELGVTSGAAVALPLASFNAGVEAGQLAVALALWPVVTRLQTPPFARFQPSRVCSIAIAGLGTVWLVERLAG